MKKLESTFAGKTVNLYYKADDFSPRAAQVAYVCFGGGLPVDGEELVTVNVCLLTFLGF